jgi:hypothetical protein
MYSSKRGLLFTMYVGLRSGPEAVKDRESTEYPVPLAGEVEVALRERSRVGKSEAGADAEEVGQGGH